MKKYLYFLFILFVSVIPLFATDWYVNFDGSNGDGTSTSTPWNNWADAKKSGGSVQNGDTVYMWGTGGGASFTSSDSGASGAYITYQTRPGYALILDGNDGGSLLKFYDNAAYLKFIGTTPTDEFDTSTYKFTITDDGEGIEFTYASSTAANHITFQYILFTYIDGYSSITTESGHAAYITVDGNYMDSVGGDGGDHGMYFTQCDHCIITNNKVRNSTGNGINFQTRYGYTSDSTIIAGNWVWGSGQVANGYGIRLGYYQAGDENNYTNFKIYNNFVWGNARSGLHSYNQNPGNLWYNNTSYNNSECISVDGTSTSSLEFRNNACYGNSGGLGSTGSATVSNNPTTSPPYVSTTFGNANFLKLDASASAYIDVGYDTSAVVTDDIFGNSRDANIDIGAHEYGAGSDTTAPATTISTSDPQYVYQDSLTLQGNCTDAVGVTSVKFRLGSAPDASNGTACTCDDGTCNGTDEDWTCTVTGMSLGSNTVYAGCGDAAANWGAGDSITAYFNYKGVFGTATLSNATIR